jgi:hypothetical protein
VKPSAAARLHALVCGKAIRAEKDGEARLDAQVQIIVYVTARKGT